MRSIGLKIFLSFWLIFAVLIASFAILPDRISSVRFSDHVRQHGQVAAAALEQDGASACAQVVAAVERGTRMQLVVLGRDSAPLCFAPTTDLAAFRSVRSVQEGVVLREGGATLAVVGVRTPAGRPLRAVARTLGGIAAVPVRPPVPWGPLGLAIVVSGLVCFVVARYLAKPLQLVRDASNRLASGQLQARAGPTGEKRRDEVGDLVRAFDSMAGRIEALVHAQSRILSDISHELRSPLARLGVALELARRKSGDVAEPEFERIEIESERMNELIGRVLVLARAEQHPSAPRTVFSLRALVGDVAADASYEAGQQDKSVSFRALADPQVSGDPTLIASAVDNVIRNAVRHTRPQGDVEVTLTLDVDAAVVAVRDHGPGVPAAELERIFSPFHRVEPSRTRTAGDDGVGLGLSIARRAIHVHGGTIAAENAEGGGLRVAMRIPVDRSAADLRAGDTS